MRPSGFSPLEDAYQAQVLRAHEDLRAATGATDQDGTAVRPAVLDSWRRSLAQLKGRTAPPARPVFDGAALETARAEHLFHALLPLLRSRLIDPAVEAGMLVALGDARGRLLWVEGRSPVLARAEAMGFAPGADWSEGAMGTSAPGLALTTGGPVQVVGAEHFVEAVHPWSCSAVPVRDPLTGRTIGVIDVTGDGGAVAPLVLPLLQSTARAAEDALRARREGASAARIGTDPADAPELLVLGRRTPLLRHGGMSTELTGRHAELLLALHLHEDGTSAGELAEQLHGTLSAEGTVRAELVRLRRTLREAVGDGVLALGSRPYRLRGPLTSDVDHLREALHRADPAAVLDAYRGPLLLASEAPALVQLRGELSAHAREVVLAHGGSAQLWRMAQLPESAHDEDLLMAILALAAPDAPERDGALIRLEAIGR